MTETTTVDPAPLLEADGVFASYGATNVLFGVSLRVPVQSRLALLGTNGAGKSTLLKVVAGLLPCREGRIVFGGVDITRLDAVRRVRAGICLVSGGRMIFPTLSVLDNLRMGAYPNLKNKDLVRDRIDEACELFPRLRALMHRHAGALSSGEKQMVSLSRALMSQPRLLMIDEFSLGLAPVLIEALIPSIESLSARGMTILLVEQSLDTACRLTEECYFLEKGEVSFCGPTVELVERGDIARAVFLGGRGATQASNGAAVNAR